MNIVLKSQICDLDDTNSKLDYVVKLLETIQNNEFFNLRDKILEITSLKLKYTEISNDIMNIEKKIGCLIEEKNQMATQRDRIRENIKHIYNKTSLETSKLDSAISTGNETISSIIYDFNSIVPNKSSSLL